MLSLETRFNCPRSYATEETPDLMCEVGNMKCDGILYECCLWGLSYAEEVAMITEFEREDKTE